MGPAFSRQPPSRKAAPALKPPWATRMAPPCSGSKTSPPSPSRAAWTPPSPRSSGRWWRRRCPRVTRVRWRSTCSGSTTPTTTATLTSSSFMLIFHIMSDGTPEEVLEKIFRVFDVNSDGTINKKEMQRLIKDMYGLIKADDPEAESKDLVAKSAFAEMDKDADGKITCSEFTTACLSQEKISKILALKVIDIFVEED